MPHGFKYGNENELGDVGASPGNNSLLLVKTKDPKSGLPGDGEHGFDKQHGFCGVQCVRVDLGISEGKKRCFRTSWYPCLQKVPKVKSFW